MVAVARVVAATWVAAAAEKVAATEMAREVVADAVAAAAGGSWQHKPGTDRSR